VKPHYPELPEPGTKFFSLVWYLRKSAEKKEIETEWIKKIKQIKPNKPLINAMIHADCEIDFEIRTHIFPRVLETGQLLFAFPGTTALQGAA
jgi:hypothetical protein